MASSEIRSSKKILILYASAGHGHEKAAKAIQDAAQRLYPGAKILCKDTVKLCHPFYGWQYREVYFFLIGKTPWLWGFYYAWFDKKWMRSFLKGLRRVLNGTFGSKVEKTIQDFNPDVVITTHFMANEITGYLKATCLMYTGKLVTVITDYMPHELWIHPRVDSYVVALEATKQGLIHRGVEAEKIQVLGIPTEDKFHIPLNEEAIREKIGLDKNIFTVLLTSGGAAVGDLFGLAKGIVNLKTKVQLLVVCGTNNRLFCDLEVLRQSHPELKLFGFIDNMHELMHVSDIVIGKGGGLTVSEALAKQKPMIIYRPLPGQEKNNAILISQTGAGFYVQSASEAIRILGDMLDHPEKLATCRQNTKIISRPHASDDIVELALR